MKTSTKWFIGILVGVVVVAAVACLGVMAWNLMSGGWEYGFRSGRLWSDDSTPGIPPNPRVMPMHPFATRTGSWYGFFGWCRPLIGALFCLGLPLLLVIAGVLLVRGLQSSSSRSSTQAQVPVPAAAGEKPLPKTEELSCSHCGKPVQDGWSHCPHCGTPR